MSCDGTVRRIIASLFTITQLYEITKSEFIENGFHIDFHEEDEKVLRALAVKLIENLEFAEQYKIDFRSEEE